MTADTKASEIRRLHLKRTREHESWLEWWWWGRQEVHSREESKFKVAMGVFWSWKFTWAGWPKSQQKKRQKTSISKHEEVAIKDLKERKGDWVEWWRKGGHESEGLLSLLPSRICGVRERSARWNLRKDAQNASKQRQKLNRFSCICCPVWASVSLGTAGNRLLSLLIYPFSHHAWLFCNLSIMQWWNYTFHLKTVET